MWINTAEAEGQPGVDDDGNGYIDGRLTPHCAHHLMHLSHRTSDIPYTHCFAVSHLQIFMDGIHGGKGEIRWTSEGTDRIVQAQLQVQGSEFMVQPAQETKSSSSDVKHSPSSQMASVP